MVFTISLLDPLWTKQSFYYVNNSYTKEKMTTQFKNISVEKKLEFQSKEKPKIARPNIDHLIKRILVERRNEQKKIFLLFIFVLLVIVGITLFTL
tara:strand:+ start:151 stop:435 length:285 start_codon:yes stop_codon:yes gene_type:complete